jgi:hypothetical protein
VCVCVCVCMYVCVCVYETQILYKCTVSTFGWSLHVMQTNLTPNPEERF